MSSLDACFPASPERRLQPGTLVLPQALRRRCGRRSGQGWHTFWRVFSIHNALLTSLLKYDTSMACTMRRGSQFSSFELEGLDLAPIERLNIFQARVSLTPYLREASQAGQALEPPKGSASRITRFVDSKLFLLQVTNWSNGTECVDPKLIVDADGQIVAVLLGRPEGDDWDDVMAEMEHLLEAALGDGVTKGPGQKKPGNLAHLKEYRQLLQLLISNRSIRRIARFQSSKYMHLGILNKAADDCGGVFENQPHLAHLFANSIFPATTWNLGPDVVTAEHEDGLNVWHGMCGVTSGTST
ncbi:hypothetical protein B0H10DRAFT_2218662 [Mycena sp. CBHHK59/15]|nr:hypothetical protein B0H10DRAFT_2218662 [Mycena sp. CBHHK59/15]